MTLPIPDTRYFCSPFLMLGLLDLWAFSIPLLINSSVRRAITERIDTFLPERIKRSLPRLSRLRSQQENELTSLIVNLGV
ncbi:hypothetical protein SETIT_4G038200v2 [Setaria italica]|uniref:Uncharacterized protein n=1 Tax=Setaria italica TaxID=4555 RepID=A0A368QQW4_SETIT|nr:hypothetical protein SETIT_4G038200v2 [Setaria italica]